MTRLYRFGDFRLDPATRELWRGESPIAVPPRAFECIVYLIEHRERAVGRDELIAAVWGRTETGDGTLGQTVLAARRALDDTGKEQHAIRTVFRFGYHWVAPVDVVDEVPMEPSVVPIEPVETTVPAPHDSPLKVPPPEVAVTPVSQQATRWLPILVAGALIVALIVLLSWRSISTRMGEPSRIADASGVALVLPVTVNAASGYDWVRLGLMDLIGSRLRAAGLPVVPSDNVVALTGHMSTSPDLASLARAAGASLVIETRADLIGDHWRVSLRTMRGRIPALTASSESTDVLTAARAAADQLARQLGFAPTSATSKDAERSSIDDLSQRIEAAMLSDHIDAARALIASATPAERAQPELRLRTAQIAYQAGDFDAAEAGFNAVAAAAPAEQDPVLHARAISNLGVIAAMRDDPVAARRRFDEAIDLLRARHAPDALGKALLGRANINGLEDHDDAALRDFAEARASLESAGNVLALAVLDSNLAAMDMHRFHYAEAEPVFQRAAERFATFGVNAAELNALTGAAELELALLEPDVALGMEPRLRELLDKVADPARKRAGELTRAQILLANGRLHECGDILAHITRDAESADDRSAMTRAHLLRAALAWQQDDGPAAVAESDTALKNATTADDVRDRARLFRLHIVALLGANEVAAAKSAAQAFSTFAEDAGSPPALTYAQLAVADVAAAIGDASAGATYAKALADADASRIPLDVRDAAAAYAHWLVRSGDLVHAGAVAERVAGWSSRDYDSALIQLEVQSALGNASLQQAALTRAQALAGERVVPTGRTGHAARSNAPAP